MSWSRNLGLIDRTYKTEKFLSLTRVFFSRRLFKKLKSTKRLATIELRKKELLNMKKVLKSSKKAIDNKIPFYSLQNMYQFLLQSWGMTGITGFMQTLFMLTLQRMLLIIKTTTYFFDELAKEFYEPASGLIFGNLLSHIIFVRGRKAAHKKYIITHAKYPSTRGIHSNTKMRLFLNKTVACNHYRFGYKHFSGRSSTGSISVYSKCARLKHRGINYSKNLNFLTYYISVLYFVRDFPQTKFAAYVTTGSGFFGFIPMVCKMALYIISFGALFITDYFRPATRAKFLNRIGFCEALYLVKLNTKISYITDQNYGRVKFLKSAAVCGTLISRHTFINKTPVAMIRMPSKQVKAVTAMQVVLYGATLPIKKKFYKYTRAGF